MSETTAAWKRSSLFDDILYRFEKDYRAGKNPQVNDYLEGTGERRWQLLMELLHSDLELRLRAGEQLRVRDYFAKFPKLEQRPADILALLAVELRFLQDQGQQPILEEYENNYGKLLPSSLKPLFEQSRQKPYDSNLGKLIANRYKLIGVLGQGGMGTVYLAEQSEPVKRQVALKLISAGIDSRNYITRFEAERQALAVMDHPTSPVSTMAARPTNNSPSSSWNWCRVFPSRSIAISRSSIRRLVSNCLCKSARLYSTPIRRESFTVI